MQLARALPILVALALGGAAVDAAAQDPPGGKVEVGVLRLTRPTVQRVKQVLTRRGYAIATDEGKIDGELLGAVRRFQMDAGIAASGELDLVTLDALGFGAVVAIAGDVEGAEIARRRVTGVTERPAGLARDAAIVGGGKDIVGFVVLGRPEIEAIETWLKRAGFYGGEVRGAYSRELEDAIRNLQKSLGLEPASGVLDLTTLAWFPGTGVKVREAEPDAEKPAPAPGESKEGKRSRGPAAPADWLCPRCQTTVHETSARCDACALELGTAPARSR